MSHTIPALTITDAQRETIETLTGGDIQYAYVRPIPDPSNDGVFVTYSDEYIQFCWSVQPDGSHTTEWRGLDSDGWNDGEYED